MRSRWLGGYDGVFVGFLLRLKDGRRWSDAHTRDRLSLRWDWRQGDKTLLRSVTSPSPSRWCEELGEYGSGRLQAGFRNEAGQRDTCRDALGRGKVLICPVSA